MPELPDVEIRKRYLDSTALHQKIETVEVNAPVVLDGLTQAALGKALAGQSFESTRRHGKYLFIELSEGRWMGMHFGMTGDLQYYKKPDQQSEYEHVLFHFQNVYSDEILYQARIYPRQQIKELEDGGLQKVYNSMKEVLETAIERHAEPAQYPDSYLIPHRSEGEPCPHCGGKVQKIEVSGRSGYYCPDCQEG